MSNPVKLGDWIGLDPCGKAWGALRHRTSRRAQRDVLELGLAHEFVAAGDEGLGLLRSRASFTHDILARVLEGIAQRVASEVTEGLFRAPALIDGHTLVKADFVALLAESLIASARITNGQTGWHGEKSVALAINERVKRIE